MKKMYNIWQCGNSIFVVTTIGNALKYATCAKLKRFHILAGVTLLRAIAGNTSYIKIFFVLCILFVLCMDCQFMKSKGYVTTLNFS